MKQVKVCLGRFQPFTLGHIKMATINKLEGPQIVQGFKGPIDQSSLLREQPDLNEIEKQKTIILSIYTPKEKIDDKHPFDYDLMKKELDIVKRNSPEIEDILYVTSADICMWGEMLKQKGYQASVWITGEDEAKPYVEMAMKVPEYEEHNRDNRDCKGAFSKSFYVEVLKRTDNSDDFTESISGTKVREAINNGDIDYYKKAMPKGTDILFDEFKKALENVPEKPVKKKMKSMKESLNMRSITDYINERYENAEDKSFDISGEIKNYKRWSNVQGKDITFTSISLVKHYYDGKYYWYVLPINDSDVIKIDNVEISLRIEDFCKKIVDKQIITKDYELLNDMLVYYMDNQKDKYLKNIVYDTDIMDILDPKIDRYDVNGSIKIDTQNLNTIITIQNVIEDTRKLREEKNAYGVGPIDKLSGSDIKKLGEFLHMPLSKYSDVEGNEGHNFINYCGITCEKNGKSYEIIKTNHREFSNNTQDQVYDILMEALKFDISNINDLYITNHNDANTSKCTRNNYLETSILYLGKLIKFDRKDDYNWYSGKTYDKLTFSKKDKNLLNDWIKVFNYDINKIRWEEEGNNIIVTIKYSLFD